MGHRLAALLAGDDGSAVARLAAVTAPVGAIDPISLFAAAVEAGLEAALWLRAQDGIALVGVGRAWATEPEGPGRFVDAERDWREVMRTARVAGASPVLMGGLGFTGRRPAEDDAWAPFGPSSLVLPQLVYSSAADGATVTASVVGGADDTTPGGLDRQWATLERRAREIEPSPTGIVARPVFAPLTVVEEQPSHEAWDRLVGTFAGAVGRGRIDKVVLARRVGFRSPVELDVGNALRRLALSAPESTTYAFRRGGSTLLGSTPERLARTETRCHREEKRNYAWFEPHGGCCHVRDYLLCWSRSCCIDVPRTGYVTEYSIRLDRRVDGGPECSRRFRSGGCLVAHL